MHLAIKSQISSEYLAIHDCQIVIKYNQIILVLNNLIGKTYITSCSPDLDRPPPSTRLGQCRMQLVSHKSRGGCLIYLPFTTAISQKNTQQ
jgi:hypothetical protein